MNISSARYKIAVAAHIFYPEQTQALVELLMNIASGCDIYVSVRPGDSGSVLGILGNAFAGNKITVREVPNRGYDIAPFICTFGQHYADYDLVLKLHTKKSSHVPWLTGWGDYLWGNMTGSPQTISAILKLFRDNEKLGLVYPEIIPPLKDVLKKDPWQENWYNCRLLGERLGLSIQREIDLDFPAGSMFWFRPKALEPLFMLGLTAEDFPEGSRVLRNGTPAHAVERLLVLIAEKQGFCANTVCFDPFATKRDKSFLGIIRDRLYCERSRFRDFMGNL